ncbi:hypothetical protein [Streptomonospora arabica]|uniref:Sulfotransferase domain-containing protein n=1 Tax=Streptomonospora arabica TaxID=412417 RepID=A0ABV9SSN3_9ACTN
MTGTGRCGTRYASHVLRAAGVVCGHEQVFTFGVARGRTPRWRGFEADASWLAVPRLSEVRARTVLLVRHPLDVAHSMLQLGWFTPQRASISRVLAAVDPRILGEPTRADQAMALWLRWNTVARPHAAHVVRFGDLVADPAVLLRAAGVAARAAPGALEAIHADTTKTNSKVDRKQPHPRPAWGDIRPSLREQAQELAAEFGYPREET